MKRLILIAVSLFVATFPVSAQSTKNPTNAAPDVCALFTAADAARVMGAPMKVVPNRGKNVCLYQEATPTPQSLGSATVALTLTKSPDKANEDLAWITLKQVRHLQTGQKNVKAVVGVGDQAWFAGNVQQGKIGIASIVVRKGNTHFTLDVMVLEYRASADALRDIATRIATKL